MRVRVLTWTIQHANTSRTGQQARWLATAHPQTHWRSPRSRRRHRAAARRVAARARLHVHLPEAGGEDRYRMLVARRGGELEVLATTPVRSPPASLPHLRAPGYCPAQGHDELAGDLLRVHRRSIASGATRQCDSQNVTLSVDKHMPVGPSLRKNVHLHVSADMSECIQLGEHAGHVPMVDRVRRST